jgi:hypothetical protein
MIGNLKMDMVSIEVPLANLDHPSAINKKAMSKVPIAARSRGRQRTHVKNLASSAVSSRVSPLTRESAVDI